MGLFMGIPENEQVQIVTSNLIGNAPWWKELPINIRRMKRESISMANYETNLEGSVQSYCPSYQFSMH